MAFRLRTFGIGLALAFTLPILPAMAADPITWTADTDHSSAQFTVPHIVIARVKGFIPIKSATIVAPADCGVPVSIDATLDTTGLNSNDANRDKSLRSPNFFNVEKYPTMHFKSTRITPGANGTFTAAGELTLLGVTKPITLNGEYTGSSLDRKGIKNIGYTATGKLHRDDYGMTYDVPVALGGALWAGHDVQIDIEIDALPKT